jgi:riboflavin synthase
MFTGIIEEVGEVVSIEPQADSLLVTVGGPVVAMDLGPGDSVAVEGCCLTVTRRVGRCFSADVMRETLDHTSLGSLTTGSPVNLERAVTASSRLGGHIVQGHVDGTGVVLDREPSEHWEVVTISVPAALARYVAMKGSIAVDGISLTVSALTDGPEPSFAVSLIPTTLARTTLGAKPPGRRVNLEVDVVAKYVERLLSAPGTPYSGLPSTTPDPHPSTSLRQQELFS